MPDLNLVDEGGLEDASVPMPAAAPAKRVRSGGGGSKTVLIVVFLLVVAAIAVFVLNKRGVIKLWGKKPVPTMAAEAQEPDITAEQTPTETPEAVPPTGAKSQTAAPAGDTSQVALLETPPVDEYTPVQGGEEAKALSPGGAMRPAPAKPEMKPGKPELQRPAASTAMSSPKLGDMRGEFTVQVVAFREKSKADQIMDNLVDAGYPAFIEKVPMKGGEWFTVRIGRYGSRDEAKRAVDNFATQIRSSYVIDKVRSK